MILSSLSSFPAPIHPLNISSIPTTKEMGPTFQFFSFFQLPILSHTVSSLPFCPSHRRRPPRRGGAGEQGLAEKGSGARAVGVGVGPVPWRSRGTWWSAWRGALLLRWRPWRSGGDAHRREEEEQGAGPAGRSRAARTEGPRRTKAAGVRGK